MGCLHSSFCNGFTAAARARPWSFDPLCRHRCGKRSSAEMCCLNGLPFPSWPSSELSFLNGFQKDSKHANAAEKLRWSLKLWDSHGKIETTFCILHLCKLVKRTPVADTFFNSSVSPTYSNLGGLFDFNVNDYLKKTTTVAPSEFAFLTALKRTTKEKWRFFARSGWSPMSFMKRSCDVAKYQAAYHHSHW